MKRRPVVHDEECDVTLSEDGVCICSAEGFGGVVPYDAPVYGEEPSSYDGRRAGPSMDW